MGNMKVVIDTSDARHKVHNLWSNPLQIHTCVWKMKQIIRNFYCCRYNHLIQTGKSMEVPQLSQ